MKFYSEKLNTMFDDEKALVKAEDEYEVKKAAEKAHKEQLANTRKERAKAVDAAYKNYMELLNAFIKDYGSWHATYSSDDGFFSDFVKYAFTW